MIGRMRHQLEEIHERLQSGGKNTSQALSQVLNARGLTKDAALDEDQRQIDARMQAMGNSVSPPIPTRPRSSISKDQEQRPSAPSPMRATLPRILFTTMTMKMLESTATLSTTPLVLDSLALRQMTIYTKATR